MFQDGPKCHLKITASPICGLIVNSVHFILNCTASYEKLFLRGKHYSVCLMKRIINQSTILIFYGKVEQNSSSISHTCHKRLLKCQEQRGSNPFFINYKETFVVLIIIKLDLLRVGNCSFSNPLQLIYYACLLRKI